MMRDRKDIISHGQPGGNETKAARCVEQQTSMATNTSCALATDPGSSPGQALMEKICDRANVKRAYKRVKANKGAAGIDGVTIEEFKEIITKLNKIKMTNKKSKKSLMLASVLKK